MLRATIIALCALLVRSQPVPLPNLPDGWRVGTGGPVRLSPAPRRNRGAPLTAPPPLPPALPP